MPEAPAPSMRPMGQAPAATDATSAGCNAGLVGEPDAGHEGGPSAGAGAPTASLATAACNTASGRGCGSAVAGAAAVLPVFPKLRGPDTDGAGADGAGAGADASAGKGTSLASRSTSRGMACSSGCSSPADDAQPAPRLSPYISARPTYCGWRSSTSTTTSLPPQPLPMLAPPPMPALLTLRSPTM
ncbi:hypothetical protein VaNZ11_003710, partial [Volvox africanus]